MTDKRNEEIHDKENKSSGSHADHETLHTTDPQEHMKGPVSSPTKQSGDAFETNETREDAEKLRDRNV
jgi:hypothetical protein